LLQHVSVHIIPSSGSHIQVLAKITVMIPMYQYRCCQCYGGISPHNCSFSLLWSETTWLKGKILWWDGTTTLILGSEMKRGVITASEI